MATTISIKHKPPKMVSNITAILALLMGSRAILIDSLPIDNEQLIEALSGWFEYILNTAGIIMGIASILLGVEPEKPDTDNP